MAKKKTQAEIEFKVIDDGLKSELKSISNEMTKSRQTMKLTQEQMKNTGSETDKLSADLKGLKEQYDLQTKKVNEIRSALEKAKTIYGENSTEVQKYEKDLRSAEIYQAKLGNSVKETSQKLSVAKGDVKTYASSMDEITQAQKKLVAEQELSNAKFKKWQSTAGQTATDAEKLAQAQKHAGEQSKIASQQVDLLKRALTLTEQEFGSTSTEATQMKSKLAQAETEMSELSRTAKNVDTTNINDIGKKIDMSNLMQASDAIGEVSEKVLDIGKSAFNMANDFSSGAAEVANGTNRMKMSTDDVEKHISQIGSSGVGNFDEITDAVKTTTNQVSGLNEQDLNQVTEAGMNLDKIFGSDVDETMRGVDGLMKNFGLSSTEAMDLMVKGTQRGLDKSHELGDNMAEYSQLWSQMGFSSSDTFRILENGLKGGAYNLDKVNDFVKEFGVSLTDGRMEDSIGKFSSKTQGLFSQYKAGKATAKDVFGSVITDINKTKNKQDKLSMASNLWSSLGEDNAMKVIEGLNKSNKAYDNTKGSAKKLNDEMGKANTWQGMINDLQTALLPLGNMIASAIGPAIEKISELAKWFGKLPGPVKTFILVLGGVLVAVGTLMPIISSIMTIVASFGTVVLGPMILIIGGIVLAITAVIVAIQNWGNIVNWLKGVWSGITEFFSGLWNGIKQGASTLWDGVTEKWSTFIEGAKGVWNSVASFFSGLWNGIKQGAFNLWNGVTEKWSAFIEGVKGVWNSILGFFSGLWNGIKTVFDTGARIVALVFMSLYEVIKAIWTVIWHYIGPVITSIVNTISNGFKRVFNFTVSIFTSVANFINKVWQKIVNFIKPILNAIGGAISRAWNKIKNITVSVFNAVKRTFTNVWNGIKNFISPIVNAVKNSVSKAWSKIKSVTSSIFNSIRKFVFSVWNGIKKTIGGVVDSIKGTVSKVWSKIKSVTSSVFNGIKKTVSSIWNGIKNVIKVVVGSIKSAVSGAWNGIKSATSRVFGGLKRIALAPFNGIKTGISKALSFIKRLFDRLHLNFPKIKMPPLPHFSLSGKFSLKPLQVPHINVKWFAKGGIMNAPTMFGMSGGSPMIGGEAGSEAILPLDRKNLSVIGEKILQSTQNSRIMSNNITNTFNINNTIGNEMDLNHVTKVIVNKITQGQQSSDNAFA